MKKIVTILFLWFATLLWIATTIVPHHHHNGTLVIGSNLSHADCQEQSCTNTDSENCCNNNDCEECPLLKYIDFIIKKGDSNDEEKIKFIIADYASIENYRYSFLYTKSINIYSHYSVTKTISHTKYLQLRAPPFA